MEAAGENGNFASRLHSIATGSTQDRLLFPRDEPTRSWPSRLRDSCSTTTVVRTTYEEDVAMPKARSGCSRAPRLASRPLGWLTAAVSTLSAVAVVGLTAPPAEAASGPPSAPATPRTSAPASPTVQPAVGTWLHQPTSIVLTWGDTLWQIAETYGVSVAALEAANNLGTSTTIYAGDTLFIPGQWTAAQPTTLAAAAAALNVSVASLAEENPNVSAGGTLPADTSLSVPPASSNTAESSPSVSAQDLSDLAHLVQAEAGDQPFVGMVAVAAVVLNRVRAPGFPKTIPGVIFAPGQFESVQNGTFWQAPSALAYQAAEAALAGEDPSHGALFYYNPALTNNSWIEGLPVVARIANQVFCQ